MSRSGTDTHTKGTVGRSAVTSDQNQTPPAVHWPAIPLPPGTLYHFSVLYNHARSVHSKTADTERSLAWTRRAVEVLELRGLVNSYYHDRDCPSGQALGLELGRVTKASRVTVLLLSPGFVRDCWPRYCLLSCFKLLLLNGTFIPSSSPPSSSYRPTSTDSSRITHQSGIPSLNDYSASSISLRITSSPSAEQAQRFWRSAYSSADRASFQSTSSTSVSFPSSSSCPSTTSSALATDSSAIVLVTLGLKKDELPEDLKQRDVIVFADEYDQERGAWAQLTNALMSVLPQSEAYVKAAVRAAEELAPAHGATLVPENDTDGERPRRNEAPSPEGPGRRADAAAAFSHSHPAPISLPGGTVGPAPSLGNRIASPLPALSTSGTAACSDSESSESPISTTAHTGSHPFIGQSPVTAGTVNTSENLHVASGAAISSRESTGRETVSNEADERRESLLRESNSISTEDSVPYVTLVLSADLNRPTAVSSREKMNTEGVSRSQPRAATRQRHSDSDGDGDIVKASVEHHPDDVLVKLDFQRSTETPQDVNQEQANETQIGMFSGDAADGGNTQHEVEDVSARNDPLADDQHQVSPRHGHLTSEDGIRNLNVERVNKKVQNSVSPEEVAADGIDKRKLVLPQDDTEAEIIEESQFNFTPVDPDAGVSDKETRAGSIEDTIVENTRQHTITAENRATGLGAEGFLIFTSKELEVGVFEQQITLTFEDIKADAGNFEELTHDDNDADANDNEHLSFIPSDVKEDAKNIAAMTDSKDNFIVASDDAKTNVDTKKQTITPDDTKIKAIDKEVVVMADDIKANLDNQEQLTISPDDTEASVGNTEQLTISPKHIEVNVVQSSVTTDRKETFTGVTSEDIKANFDNKDEITVTSDNTESSSNNIGQVNVTPKEKESDIGNKEQFSVYPQDTPVKVDTEEQITVTVPPEDTEGNLTNEGYIPVKAKDTEVNIDNKEQTRITPDEAVSVRDNNGQFGVTLTDTESDLNNEKDLMYNIKDEADFGSTKQLTSTSNNTETSIDSKEKLCITPTYVETNLRNNGQLNVSPEDTKADADHNGQGGVTPEDKVVEVDADYKDELVSAAVKCMVAEVDVKIRLDVTPEGTVRQDCNENMYVEESTVYEDGSDHSPASIRQESCGVPAAVCKTTDDVSSDQGLLFSTSVCLKDNDTAATDTMDDAELSKRPPEPSSQVHVLKLTEEAESIEDKALDEGNASDTTETANALSSVPEFIKASQSKEKGVIFLKKTTEGTCFKGDVETAVLDRLAQTGIRRHYEYYSSQNRKQKPTSTEPLLPTNNPQSERYRSNKAENVNLLNNSSFSDATDTLSDSTAGDSVTLQHQVNAVRDLSCMKSNSAGDIVNDFTNGTVCYANIPALEETVKNDAGANDQKNKSTTKETLACSPGLVLDTTTTTNTHSSNSKTELETSFIFRPGPETVCIEDTLDEAAQFTVSTVSLTDSVCADQQQYEHCPSQCASERSQENDIIVNLPTSIPMTTENIVNLDWVREQPEQKKSRTFEDTLVNERSWVTSLEDSHNLSITTEDPMSSSLTTSDYGTLSPRLELNSESDTSHSHDSTETIGMCSLTFPSSFVDGGKNSKEIESIDSMTQSRFESSRDYSSVEALSGLTFTTKGELTESRMLGEASVVQSVPFMLGQISFDRGLSLTGGNDEADAADVDNEDKSLFTGDSHQVCQAEETSAVVADERESSKSYQVGNGTKYEFQQKPNQLEFLSSSAGKDMIILASEESKDDDVISDNLLDVDGKAVGTDSNKPSENQLKMVGAYNLISTDTNDGDRETTPSLTKNENYFCKEAAWGKTDQSYSRETIHKDSSIQNDNETVSPPAVLPDFSMTDRAQHPEEQIGEDINMMGELRLVASGSTGSRRSCWTYEDIDKGWMARRFWAPFFRIILHALTRSEMPYF